LPSDFDNLVRKGDRQRDSRQWARAAEFYGRAVQIDPKRADIWVQLGNMLKDSRQFARAEGAYRTAIGLADEADTHLQLGHLFKMLGNRDAALVEYERAVERDLSNSSAIHELAEMGQAKELELRARGLLYGGSLETLWSLSGKVAALRQELDRVSRLLPDAVGRSALPVSMYNVFRDLYPIPAPPQIPAISFHIVLLAERESVETLFRQMEGVCAQSMPSWTLSVVGHHPDRRRAVELISVAEPRIKWVEISKEETGEAAETRVASHTSEEWLLLLAAGAILDSEALAWFAFAANCCPADTFVCDEEAGRIRRGRVSRSDPVLRQVPDYDALLESNVFGETVAIRSSAYRAAAPGLPGTSTTADRTALFLGLARSGRIGHVPYPLVWRTIHDTPKPGEHQDGVAAHLERTGLSSGIELAPGLSPAWRPRNPHAAIAVIIPTKDNAAELERMVESLRTTAIAPKAVNFLIVDNGSRQELDLRILCELEKQEGVELLRMDQPFNWSHLNNQAAAKTGAELLLFANDDMEMKSTAWDARLRGLLEREEIGAVGAKLLYEDGTIQHAGILFGWQDGVIHDGLHAGAEMPGPGRRWQVTRSVSAATGAFLATRRSDFLALGGFDAVALPVAYSDVDYALKLRSHGKRILWTPAITLLHRESRTRGLDRADDWRAIRNAHEQEVMQARWGDVLEQDPSVHPCWWPAALPFQLIAPAASERVRKHIQLTGALDPWSIRSRPRSWDCQ